MKEVITGHPKISSLFSQPNVIEK